MNKKSTAASPAPAKRSKPKVLSIWVSDEEHAKIVGLSTTIEMPYSVIIRKLVTGYMTKKLVPNDLPRL